MLSFVVNNKKLQQQSKPLPKLRPGWALIRVRLAGICNTDIEILRGYHAFRGTPGHEFVGEVADVAGVSAELKKRWLGKRVAGQINVSCSAYGYRPLCDFCKRGLKTHCAAAPSSASSRTTAPSPNTSPCPSKICTSSRAASA